MSEELEYIGYAEMLRAILAAHKGMFHFDRATHPVMDKHRRRWSPRGRAPSRSRCPRGTTP